MRMTQIPADLVVKFRTVDIAEVIWDIVGRRRSSKGRLAAGNQGTSCSPHLKPFGLPLNPVESEGRRYDGAGAGVVCQC